MGCLLFKRIRHLEDFFVIPEDTSAKGRIRKN
uniref:Uncharacterized protein n=1 Tax=Caenorhabditis japonica TaxID=281687 RepID=A0A8R1IVN2_CAEJA